VAQGSAASVSADKGRVLVVDDEPEICSLVEEILGRAGYMVEPCASGVDLDAALASGPADLVLLDISMPAEDGLSIARRLRAAGAMPIMMLTSQGGIADRISGLEIGADDYVGKPFEPRELLARVRAVLRRTALAAETRPAASVDPGVVDFGRVSLDRGRRCLVDGAGTRTEISTMEYRLLDTLARNPNCVLTRERLFDNEVTSDTDRIERTVNIRIARVRQKVEIDPGKPQVIRTIRNVGYMFVPPRTGQ
jgi:two-component system, OmpR family, response regulator